MRTSGTDCFFVGKEAQAALFNQLAARMHTVLGPFETRVQKTQITFVNPRVFACVSQRLRNGIVLTIGLPDMIASPRIWQASEIRPGRWTLHIQITRETELDDELMGWICAAYAFAQR